MHKAIYTWLSTNNSENISRAKYITKHYKENHYNCSQSETFAECKAKTKHSQVNASVHWGFTNALPVSYMWFRITKRFRLLLLCLYIYENSDQNINVLKNIEYSMCFPFSRNAQTFYTHTHTHVYIYIYICIRVFLVETNIYIYIYMCVCVCVKKDIDTQLTKAWTANDRLSIIWKSDLTDKGGVLVV